MQHDWTVDFLDRDPFPFADINVDVTCDDQSAGEFHGWSLSPDGAEPTAEMMINPLGPKYGVDGTTLHINNVSASDEGLYRCVYQAGNEKTLCIYVFGKSV